MARFTVKSIEKRDVDGVPSYIMRGDDEHGSPAAFNVPRKLFPQCEDILDREPGTEITKVFGTQWQLTGINIVKLARKFNNHRARKKQRRERRGGFVHF